jgi:hypothetical protein
MGESKADGDVSLTHQTSLKPCTTSSRDLILVAPANNFRLMDYLVSLPTPSSTSLPTRKVNSYISLSEMRLHDQSSVSRLAKSTGGRF